MKKQKTMKVNTSTFYLVGEKRLQLDEDNRKKDKRILTIEKVLERLKKNVN